ncbi:MAG: DUF721 domain-containing protein [Akkermansiaceae bacterium]|nr:DUF721 domain-containing protein [Akkermansiaceae bacterium]NNM30344.1 DUF721 domain-containing protein [Akkermansiaceae bacterium]
MKRRPRPRRSDRDSVRARVLAEWRGAGEPLDLNRNMVTAAEVLEGILEKLSLQEGIDEGSLREAWGEVAGEFIAKQTEPVSLRDGVLNLKVLQPAMRFHLEQSRGEMLQRLQRHLGKDKIREVRLTIG